MKLVQQDITGYDLPASKVLKVIKAEREVPSSGVSESQTVAPKSP